MKGQPVYKPPFHQINIRRSSNGLGRGDVQPNMWFKSHLASQLNMGRYPVAGSGSDCKSDA